MSGQNGQSNENTQTNWKLQIITASISGICVIMSSIIGIFSYNINESNKTLTVENITLTAQNNDWETSYNELQKQFNELDNKNTSLSSELNNLKSNLDKYSSIEAENNTLKAQVFELKNQLQLLNDSIEHNSIENNSINNQTNASIRVPDTSINNTDNKVSIFDLETFRGDGGWFIPSHDYEYTDTYGNEYPKSHVANHYSTSKDNLNRVPTYLLNYQYSLCEGQIAWAKIDKNASGSVWIDFYSGDTLIYSTDRISATDKTITFSFSVEGIETLTIVKNSSRLSTAMGVIIIYPFLNLVK